MGVSVLAASAALTGAGFVGAPAPTPAEQAHDVALTAIPSYITDWQGLLNLFGLGGAPLSTAMVWIGMDPDTTFDAALSTFLGSFGQSAVGGYLTWMPDMTVGEALGMVGLHGTSTMDEVLISLSNITGLVGFDLAGVTVGDVETWLGLPVDPSLLSNLGLTDDSTLSQIFDSNLVGEVLGLSQSLGAESINGLLGIGDDSVSLTDMMLGLVGLQGTDTMTEAIQTLLGVDDGTSLITGLGDLAGIPGLDGSTTLNDLLTDIGTLLGSLG